MNRIFTYKFKLPKNVLYFGFSPKIIVAVLLLYMQRYITKTVVVTRGL